MASQFARSIIGLALVATLAFATGCNTGGGGGGGGGNDNDTAGDPLPQYQLGADPDLDADIADITTSFNAALACIGEESEFTEEQNLAGLKESYTGDAGDFPAFVEETRVKTEARTDEVCNTDLGGDPELDTLVAQLTAAINRGRVCRGDLPSRSDEESLLAIKQAWLDNGFVFGSLVETAGGTEQAQGLVPAAEQLADEQCGETG